MFFTQGKRMYRAYLLFFLCGVVVGLPMVIFKLTAAYLKQWDDASRIRRGYTKEEWKNQSLEIPYIPSFGLAIIIGCVVTIFVSILIVVLLTLYLGPAFLTAIAVGELVHQILEDPNAHELLPWKGGALILIGTLFSRFVIEALANSIFEDVKESIDTEDETAIPKDSPNISK